jgi:hypothetical protein
MQLQEVTLDGLITSKLSAVLADAGSCEQLRVLRLFHVNGSPGVDDVRAGLRVLVAGRCKGSMRELLLGCGGSCRLDLKQDVVPLLTSGLTSLLSLGLPLQGSPVRGQQQCRRWLAKQLQRLPQLRLSSDEVQLGNEDSDLIGRGVALCSVVLKVQGPGAAGREVVLHCM